MDENPPPNDHDLASALADAIGPDQVTVEVDDLVMLSADLFTWDGFETPEVVVTPAAAVDVASILNIARSHKRPVYVRGGGMSYTNGYGPTQPGSILVDLRSLNRVREVDVTNRYVIAEAGCTWADVGDALKDTNMIVDFPAALVGKPFHRRRRDIAKRARRDARRAWNRSGGWRTAHISGRARGVRR